MEEAGEESEPRGADNVVERKGGAFGDWYKKLVVVRGVRFVLLKKRG